MGHGYYSLVLLFGVTTWLTLRHVEPGVADEDVSAFET